MATDTYAANISGYHILRINLAIKRCLIKFDAKFKSGHLTDTYSSNILDYRYIENKR